MFNLVTTFFCLIIFLKSFAHCCTCNTSKLLLNSSPVTVKTNYLKDLMSVTDPEYEETTTVIAEQSTETTISDIDNMISYVKVTEEINNEDAITDSVTVNKTYDTINVTKYTSESCFHFKNGADIDFNGMVDVWETKYYKLQDAIPCFKILIRKTTREERIQYSRMYYNLNTKVNWTNTILEVVSNALPKTIKRRHFLNGVREDQGVLDNIIILENYGGNVTIIDESPDQWLLSKNLLLMRDCDNGDVVLFTRVPYTIRNEDMINALLEFGENGAPGKMACGAGDEKYTRMKEEFIDD